MTDEQETNHAFARSRSNAMLERTFEQWWESNGQFCRAGGGQYEKTFAYEAWVASATEARETAMDAILDGCPNDFSDTEIILRRAWDRVRLMFSNVI